MIRVLLAICFACSINTCMAGWDEWSDTDKKLFVASNIAIFGDWQTTRDISRNPNDYREVGLIPKMVIGEHPSASSVDLYFLARFAVNYYLADTITGSNKTLYLTIATVSHGAAAVNNYNIGLRIRF